MLDVFTLREHTKGMSHATLIDSLGGTGPVSKRLGVSQSRVANWRERGVSWQWRPAIADFAKEKDVRLPAGFLVPEEGERVQTG